MRARLLLLAAALAAFGASLGSGFHFDDYAIFSMPLSASLRRPGPLTNLTLWLNYQAGGQTAFGYHAVNLLLHLAAVLLVYEVLRRWIPERAALMAAALFAVHPLQAEAVNYISARGAVLATVLCLCGALSLGRRVETPPDARRALRWLASAGWFLAALLAVAGVPHNPHPGGFILAQGVVMWRYLRLLVFPWGFTVDPDISIPPLWLGMLAWLGTAALMALAGWTMLFRRAWSSPGGDAPQVTMVHPAAWCAVGLALMLPAALFPARDLAADYRMYLPMVGFAAAGGLLLARIPTRAAGIAIVVLLTALSGSRTYVWMSEERLWREAVRRAPEKVRPKIQLARNVRAAEALELLGRARTLDAHDPEIPAETGKILLDERQPEAALAEFNSALALNPRSALNLNNRGVALAEIGQTEAARMDFEQALSIDPGFAEARENLTKLSGR
jgi:protein O-mannosyl-transferase